MHQQFRECFPNLPKLRRDLNLPIIIASSVTSPSSSGWFPQPTEPSHCRAWKRDPWTIHIYLPCAHGTRPSLILLKMEWMQWTVWESLAFTSTCPCSNSIQCRATIFQNIPSSNICLIILHLYISQSELSYRISESQSESKKHTSVKGHVFTTIRFWVFTLGLLKAPTPRKTIKILIFSNSKFKEYFNLFSRLIFSQPQIINLRDF